MRRSEMEELFRDPESDRVERKPSKAQSRRILRAICALANDLPGHGRTGVVFVGVEDDGSCAGIEVDDALLNLLASWRDDGRILPRPSMQVLRATIDGCEVAVILVEPALAPPVRLEGRVWVRVGSTTREATEEEERRLSERRRAADLPFDLKAVRQASLEDLDLDLFHREYLPAALADAMLEQNDRRVEDQLRGLRMLAPDGSPTVLGLLVVGEDPAAYVPGALIRFLRVDGTEITDPVRSEKTIGGPMATQLRLVDEVLAANVSEATRIEGSSVEVRTPDYPVEALRQLLRNAVQHRTYEQTNSPIRWIWYSDRNEIQSPGGPYGLLNAQNFGQPGLVDYRNPHLAEALHVLGFVQKCGIGIPLARKTLAENGNPEPEFVVEPNQVLCVVRRRP